MSSKATTHWKQMLYDSARKNDPSTHSHVIYEDPASGGTSKPRT
jgi:hypothetical protein